jgi:hypothetical protein
MTHDDAYPAVRLSCLEQQSSCHPDLCNPAQTCRSVAITLYTRFTTVLIVLALIVLAVTIAVVLRRYLAGNRPDLGLVTERWLAEYRADASRPSR